MKKKMLIEETVIAILMCVMVVMVTVHVLGRYVLHMSFSYTEEIVRYLFVWATFLGAAAAAFRRRHLSVAGAIRILPESARRWTEISCWLGSAVLAVVLVVYGARVVLLQVRTGQTTAALGFPMWIVGLAIPLCASLLLFRLGMIAYGFLRHGRLPKEAGDKEITIPPGG